MIDHPDYFAAISKAIAGTTCTREPGHAVAEPIEAAVDLIKRRAADGGKVLLFGNGGSLAACSHIANDLCLAGVPALDLASSVNMSCIANDWDFGKVFQKQIAWFAKPGDILIALSCSGHSGNVRIAAEVTKHEMITFSGFAEGNPLSKTGTLNFWVPSSNYGTVQIAHEAILHCIVDRIAGLA